MQTVLLEMDRISYFKGHSAIRQLAARVGAEALRAGPRTYFDRHAFSPLNRAMVWCQLLLAVQDAVFPAADHLALVTQMMAVESELSIIAEVLEQARFDVADRFLAPAERPHWMNRIADSIRQRLARTEAGDERQMSLFRNLIDFSSDVAELRGFLDGAAVPAGIVLDPDTCWRIEYRLAVLGELDEAQIQAAFERDPSTAGEVFVAKARAARPDPAAKSAAWQAMTSDTTLSSYQIWALAEGLWQPEQLELTEPYVQRFFAAMPDTAKLRGDLVLSELIRFLYPRYAATTDTVEFATGLMERSDISLPLRRRVADFTDDLKRVIQARESQLAVSG